MTTRNLSLLNEQIVLNSGHITNPDNRLSVIKNSERVRNDLVNITEYLNGFVYYLVRNLTNGDSYQHDAAEAGISGLTIVSDTTALSTFTDVFWLDTGNGNGRPKTIKESIQTLEAKLEQQNVNISILERVNIESIVNLANTTNLKVEKVKKNVFGETYNVSSNDLSYPLTEYVYRLYNNLFPTLNTAELSTGAQNFPTISLAQTSIDGCGTFPSLSEEMSSLKTIINGEACDPSFTVSLDQTVFDSQPTNIKGYITELKTVTEEHSASILTNATDISNLETSVNNLQGANPATTEIVGTSEEATRAEVLQCTDSGAAGGRLFINPRRFFNAITQNNQATFLSNDLGSALKKATEYSLSDLSIGLHSDVDLSNPAQGKALTYDTNSQGLVLSQVQAQEFDVFMTLNGLQAAVGRIGRHVNVVPHVSGTTITFTSGNIVVSEHTNRVARIKNTTSSGTITLAVSGGYSIDGQPTYVMSNPYEAVTIMYDGGTNFLVVSSHNH